MQNSTRRTILRVGASTGIVGIAGCLGSGGDDSTPSPTPDSGDQSDDETLGGLQLWLNPDSETVITDGSVETWGDDSGNGHDFTQTDETLQPSIVENAVAGHSALRFDGSETHLLRDDNLGIADDSPRTFVVVSRLSDLSARSPFLMQGAIDTEGDNTSYYGLEANTFRTAGERFGLYLVSVAKDTEISTDQEFNVHVLRTGEFPELTSIEESTTYYLNGSQRQYSDTAGGARNRQFTADSTAIGAFPQSSPSLVLSGEIAEIRVYDRVLSDDERSTVERNLMSKYDIEGS